jgi:lipoate-protein ligase A
MRDVSRPSHKATARQVTPLDMTRRSIFDTLDVFHDVATRSAAINMAIDEALLETATIPSIRFYRWNSPALSFGYFGRFADVANHAAERDLVRRWTGGGIVFHGDDLTYSIVVPASDPIFAESSMSIYEKVHRSLCEALTSNGQFAELASASTLDAQRSTLNVQCFANPACADVMLDGQKIAGAAQRRTRRGLLQQGSIQNVDLENGLAERFAQALSHQTEMRALGSQVLWRSQEIAEQKYATPAWLRKR